MKNKTSMRLLLGAALAAILLTGATGASAPPGFPGPEPGKTMVGVQTADLDPASLSFTVPLYLTVAATEDSTGSPRVIVPDGYLLRNTTGSVPDGTYPEIAVSGLQVHSVPGGSWSLAADPAADKEISLTIGGLPLPDLARGGASVAADLTAAESEFYDPTAGTLKPILGGPAAPGKNLPVAGALWDGFTPGEEQAAAQFRITYTVSLLDEGGQPVGVHYEGPTLEDAVNPSPSPAGP